MIFQKVEEVKDYLEANGNSFESISNLLNICKHTDDFNTRNMIALSLGDRQEYRLLEVLFELCCRPEMIGKRGSLIYSLLKFDRNSLLPFIDVLNNISNSSVFEEKHMANMVLDKITV